MLDSRWLPYRRPKANSALRLFCFAHAGGGASLFNAWRARAPEYVEVCAVQLPGREGRYVERRFTSMSTLITALANAWVPDGVPFALFGSSLGARIAFELTRELRRRGKPLPSHLFVAAARAPHRPRAVSDHNLTLDQWIERMRGRGELSDAEIAERELLELVHPILQDDLAIVATHEHHDEPALDVPLTAFALSEDARVSLEDVRAWESYTTAAFECVEVEGVHNFLKTGGAAVLDHITSRVS